MDSWFALSPGIATKEDWLEWSNLNHQWPCMPSPVMANLIKPIMRRRMSSLSKLALQVALQVSDNASIDYIIFSSRHGELTRTVKLIEDIIKGDDASPMAFSQSVHNTAAGLFTISSQRATPVTSIAAVESSLHHALIEAASYLQAHPKHHVLVVDFDEPLPEQYEKYSPSIDSEHSYTGYAFATLLSHGDDFNVSWKKNNQQAIAQLPQGLALIDFLVQQKQHNKITDKRYIWSWEQQCV